MEIDPKSLGGGERYKLLVGSIVPRPIGWISTVSRDGRANLAPYSFFNGVGSDPMTVLFCPANNADGSIKDSLRNAMPAELEGGDGSDRAGLAEGTGEFTVNVVTEGLMQAMAATAEMLAYGESEFDLAGLEMAPGVRVSCPSVAASPIAFECRTLEVVRTGIGRSGGGNVVVGEVVWIRIADELINERYHIDGDRLRAIGRLGGAYYTRITDTFEMPRGREALRDRGR